MADVGKKQGPVAPAKTAAALKKQLARHASDLPKDGMEVARTAKRAMWQCIRHAGRPGAEQERQMVVAALIPLVEASQPAAVHREVLWMLSEIGAAESVEAIASLLSVEKAREDARMALERIPGDESLAALKAALETAAEDFQPNLAQSLRARGMEVPGLPCQKLKPVKETKVTPIAG